MLRQSDGQSVLTMQLYSRGVGPPDQAALFKQIQGEPNPELYSLVVNEVTQPINEAVTAQIIAGKTCVDEESNPVEKRRSVFGFISSETRAAISAQMKQLIASMDALQRKHYENQIAKLDKLVEHVYESGERVTMSQLLARVGLDEKLIREKTNKFAIDQ